MAKLALRFLQLAVGVIALLGLQEAPPAEPLSCPLCISHIGTCGCTPLGATVCCDGYIAVGCPCQ